MNYFLIMLVVNIWKFIGSFFGGWGSAGGSTVAFREALQSKFSGGKKANHSIRLSSLQSGPQSAPQSV